MLNEVARQIVEDGDISAAEAVDGIDEDEIPDEPEDQRPAVGLLISRFALMLTAIAIALKAGRISRAAFIQQSVSVLGEASSLGYNAGLAETDPAMVGQLPLPESAMSRVAAQETYLEGFADVILAGPVPTDAAIAQRANLYSGIIWPSYQQGRAAGAQSRVDRMPDSGLEVWFDWEDSGDERECSDCPALAENGPYRMATMQIFPGDGNTICGGNCRCQLILSVRPIE